LTKIDDQAVKNYSDLQSFMAKHKPGDKVTVHFWRDNKEQTLSVTLGPAPRQRTPLGNLGQQEGNRARRIAFLGVQTQPLSTEAGNQAEAGVAVTDVVPDSAAAKAGLQKGDVITAINNQAVNGPDTLREAVRKAGVGKEVTLKVKRGQEQKTFKATLGEAPSPMSELPQLPPRGNLQPEFRMQPSPQYGAFLRDLQKVPELERQVKDLEKRVHELEQQLQRKNTQSPSK
jgi:S1-C subfamily serine protease